MVMMVISLASSSAASAERSTDDANASVRQTLRHVMVVGGTLREWADLGDERWGERVSQLGRVADEAGASFLSIRAFEQGDRPARLDPSSRSVGSCLVSVDPCGDGRQRFAEAIERIPPDEPVNEATITEALYSPADCEPDLIVILGEPTRLPPSLVWELAYGELVFHPLKWDELEAEHLVEAIADFDRRERRFGGLEE
jgi:Putative undecaprenyl diphosphate synthase